MKDTYVVRIERFIEISEEVIVDNDTEEILTGRITLAGMVLVGTQRSASGKMLMMFRERD